ncbi:MAG: phage head protein [Sphingobium sp.]|nr:MAG: phage head protein [Sphingobium sp.]
MPDSPSAVSGVLRRPFNEQVAFFRGKLGNLVPTERWDDITRDQHDTGFMVAGAQKADLLMDLGAAVDRTIAEGKSLEAFRKDFRAIVDRRGWHGWTGEGTKGGEAWRTRTIYRTNASTSYAAGRYAQLVAGDFPLWVYKHGGSEEPRPVHLALDGICLPPDHPFWKIYYGPSDWGCTCYALGARSERAARRLGGDPDKQLPEGWDAIDPRTGTPAGVGKGWDYAPGESVAPIVMATAGKVRHWDYAIAKGFMAEIPEAMRDAFAASYRSLPSVADDARRYVERVLGESAGHVQPVWTLGLVGDRQAASIAAALDGPAPDTVTLYDFSVAPSDVRHIIRRHGSAASELARGQTAVTAEDFALLPSIINAPDRIEDAGRSDVGEPIVRYVKRIAGLNYVAVFAIRKGRRTLGLKTFYIVGK